MERLKGRLFLKISILIFSSFLLHFTKLTEGIELGSIGFIVANNRHGKHVDKNNYGGWKYGTD